MRRRVLALAILLSSAAPAPAAADWLLSPYIGLRFAAHHTLFVGALSTERTRASVGASFGFLSKGVWGVEADLAFVPGFFDTFRGISGSRVTTLMGNVVLAAPIGMARYGLRPYGSAGAGYLRGRGATAGGGRTEVEVLNVDVFGMNVGGGAIGPLTERTSARFDLRYFRNLGGDEGATTISGSDLELSFWRASIGLTFRF